MKIFLENKHFRRNPNAAPRRYNNWGWRCVVVDCYLYCCWNIRLGGRHCVCSRLNIHLQNAQYFCVIFTCCEVWWPSIIIESNGKNKKLTKRKKPTKSASISSMSQTKININIIKSLYFFRKVEKIVKTERSATATGRVRQSQWTLRYVVVAHARTRTKRYKT